MSTPKKIDAVVQGDTICAYVTINSTNNRKEAYIPGRSIYIALHVQCVEHIVSEGWYAGKIWNVIPRNGDTPFLVFKAHSSDHLNEHYDTVSPHAAEFTNSVITAKAD